MSLLPSRHLNEAKKAAGALFDKLDTDKDGTLDFKELGGRLTQSEFTAANPDKDGTVSAAEFETPAGRSLSKLLS